MELDERIREVRADVARWKDRRWCRCRISPAQIEATVRTIDTERKPRTRIVDDVRDAARLSVQLHDDFNMNREPDNPRLSTVAARAAARLVEQDTAPLPAPEYEAVYRLIEPASWAARDAIGDAIRELARDCTIFAFNFRHTYASPVYAFQYRGRSMLRRSTQPCPYLGITELYLAGCFPLGYLDDHFTVFAP